MDHLISARRTDRMIINKEKREFENYGFVLQADHRIKLKECEKKDRYLDIAWEFKQLWNMKVTIVPS